MGVVWQVSIIVFATVLLARFSGMGGWTSAQILLVAATRMTCNALFVLYCGNIFTLTFLVQQGQIDGYLLRPMPVYRQVQLSSFPSNGIGDLMVGLALFAGAIARNSGSLIWTPGRVAYLAAAVVGGTLARIGELTATFGSYPLSILPRAVGELLTWVIPIAFIAYLPVGVLAGHGAGLGVPVAVAASAPLISLAAYVGSRLLWNSSLRRYTGVNG